MSRTSDSNLFTLIKSLTKGEKKNFTLFTYRHSQGEKKYLRLFELMDSQNEYNEELIKQKLREEKIRKPLPKIKMYLQQLIFKSLRSYHSGKKIESYITEQLSDIEICHEKGLKTLRNKKIKKAKQLALKYEKNEVSLLLLNKEWRYDQNSKSVLTEYEKVMQHLNTMMQYRFLLTEALKLLNKGEIREDSLKKEWDKIMRNPIINKTIEPAGHEENYYFHHIWMIYHQLTNNAKESRSHAELQVKNMESHPDYLFDNKGKYMIALNNLVAVLCGHRETDKAREAAKKLLRMQQYEMNISEKNFLTQSVVLDYSNILAGLLLVKKLGGAMQLAAEAELFIKNNRADTSYRFDLFFHLSTTYIFNDNYKLALVWNNTILNDSQGKSIEDIYALSVILNLIIHYELGHDELLPHLIRSTYRFLGRRKRLYKTEDAILRFIRGKLPLANSRGELIVFFKELKSELKKITKDVYEKKVLEYFDFISWLESKIQNRPFAEILKEKVK